MRSCRAVAAGGGDSPSPVRPGNTFHQERRGRATRAETEEMAAATAIAGTETLEPIAGSAEDFQPLRKGAFIPRSGEDPYLQRFGDVEEVIDMPPPPFPLPSKVPPQPCRQVPFRSSHVGVITGAGPDRPPGTDPRLPRRRYPKDEHVKACGRYLASFLTGPRGEFPQLDRRMFRPARTGRSAARYDLFVIPRRGVHRGHVHVHFPPGALWP